MDIKCRFLQHIDTVHKTLFIIQIPQINKIILCNYYNDKYSNLITNFYLPVVISGMHRNAFFALQQITTKLAL